MATVTIGPVVARQTTKHSTFASYQGCINCDLEKCPKGTFDYGLKDYDWPLANQRKCSRIDPDTCDKISDWSKYSEVAHHSGKTLDDAKVECSWVDIPEDKVTKENIEKYLSEFAGSDSTIKNDDRGYNDLMAAYCMEPSDNCMINPIDPARAPMTSCSNVHHGDAEIRNFCANWWDGISGTQVGDQYLSKACPDDTNRDDCQCVRAVDSAEFNELQGQIPFPSSCWFKPCRAALTNTQYRDSSHEGVQCTGAVCVNINDFSAETAEFINSHVQQTNNCTASVTNNTDLTINEGGAVGDPSSQTQTPTQMCALHPEDPFCVELAKMANENTADEEHEPIIGDDAADDKLIALIILISMFIGIPLILFLVIGGADVKKNYKTLNLLKIRRQRREAALQRMVIPETQLMPQQ